MRKSISLNIGKKIEKRLDLLKVEEKLNNP
jgi:hypothetical protein